MDENRKNIIVKEILYWKESRLLPEQYCDYLLALYTEGNQPKEEQKEKRKMNVSRKYFLLLLFIPTSLVLLYFTELSFDLQIALLTILLLGSSLLTFQFFRKGFTIHFPLVITAFLLLLISVEITVNKFPGQNTILYAVLILNCLIWLFAGKKMKLVYFTISAYLGLVTILVFLFI